MVFDHQQLNDITHLSWQYCRHLYVHDLASESDALVVACALNKDTRAHGTLSTRMFSHIINKDVLVALGKDEIIINVGQGGNIDKFELVKELKWGRIAFSS